MPHDPGPLPQRISRSAPLVGAPKDLSGIPLLSPTDIAQLIAQAVDIRSQGYPLDIPVALPAGSFLMLAATLQDMHARLSPPPALDIPLPDGAPLAPVFDPVTGEPEGG